MYKRLLATGIVAASLLCVVFDIAASPPAYAQASLPNVVGTVVVDDIPGPSVADKFTARAKTSWPWFVARGSGIVAAIALALLMLSGIGQITGDTFRFLEPLTAWASHRALGITFAMAVLAHMVSLLFDTFVPFTMLQLLVPWLSDYKPVTIWGLHLGSLYVALGVLAFYGFALVVASSLLWVEKKPRLWKWLHLLSYMLLACVFVHALYLGTDVAHGLLRLVWLALGAALAVAAVYRLYRAYTV